jgi:hypothetical protein
MVDLATEQAGLLARVVEERHLYADIGGKRFPTVQAWTFLGAMVGVYPVTEWSRPVEIERKAGLVEGWEARVIARHLASGETVGAAEAMCTRSERTWSKRDEYALRSMAETRARSKALRGPLEFVMQLAGFQTTPAEEMPREEPDPPVDSQLANLRDIVAQLREFPEDDERRVAAREAWAKITGNAGTFPSSYEAAELLLAALADLGFYPADQEPW